MDKRNTEQSYQLRVGWKTPAHLFIGGRRGSLCGQSRHREQMTAEEVQSYTSPINYPLGHLKNKSQIINFAEGICKNCLQSYYIQHDEETGDSNIDVYSKEIQNSEAENELGFCYDCGSPIDPDSCKTAKIGERYPVYMCDECRTRITADVTKCLERIGDKNGTASLGDRLENRLNVMGSHSK